MISGILLSIFGYILFIGFILCFLGGSIYIIICGVRGYLAEEDGFCLFVIAMGCVGVMIVAIIVLKAFGL